MVRGATSGKGLAEVVGEDQGVRYLGGWGGVCVGGVEAEQGASRRVVKVYVE